GAAGGLGDPVARGAHRRDGGAAGALQVTGHRAAPRTQLVAGDRPGHRLIAARARVVAAGVAVRGDGLVVVTRAIRRHGLIVRGRPVGRDRLVVGALYVARGATGLRARLRTRVAVLDDGRGRRAAAVMATNLEDVVPGRSRWCTACGQGCQGAAPDVT